MSTAAVMPSRVDLAAWDADVCRREDSYELVEGVPTMAPGESKFNRSAGGLLVTLLNVSRGNWVAGSDVDVTISEVPGTVRRPDVVVMTGVAASGAGSADHRLYRGEALFVAEVVSASSVERDLVAKRRDYAVAGIPAYLVVDLRDGRRELTLYVERGPDGLFTDVDAAEQVSVWIAGTPIEICVDDLLP